MYEVAICDDCPTDRILLENYLRESTVCRDELLICEYSSGTELLRDMERRNIAAIFLDIQMEQMDGIETARRIRERNEEVVLVFYTGYVGPSPQSIEVQPYRYMLKEMSKEKKMSYVDAALKRMIEVSQFPMLLAQIGRTQVIIHPEHVVYIEKYKKGTRIYVAKQYYSRYRIEPDEKGRLPVVRLAQPLEETYKKLEKYGFGYPHNSYIINFRYLCSCSEGVLKLADVEIEFRIARSKLKSFHAVKNHFFRSKYM